MNKKLAALGAVAFGSLAALAEGEPAIDITAATTALTDMKTAVTSYFTAAMPVVVSLIGLGLVVVLGFVGWKLVKRATNKAG